MNICAVSYCMVTDRKIYTFFFFLFCDVMWCVYIKVIVNVTLFKISHSYTCHTCNQTYKHIKNKKKSFFMFSHFSCSDDTFTTVALNRKKDEFVNEQTNNNNNNKNL